MAFVNFVDINSSATNVIVSKLILKILLFCRAITVTRSNSFSRAGTNVRIFGKNASKITDFFVVRLSKIYRDIKRVSYHEAARLGNMFYLS